MLLLLIALASRCTALPAGGADDDLIISLPGAPPNIPFQQYSGYINVNETSGKQLFYWYVESQRDPSNDPLVLWLNGGPGCSSLGGFFSENGPFNVNKDGATLSMNPYAWNRIANMVYLESPAGVGFSFSETTSDYTTGDAQTAQDSLTFLRLFFEKYPSLQGREFWITGESYGGHYVTTLAQAILEGNSDPDYESINLQGFQVGNAWTDPSYDNLGAVDFWWSHGVVSTETYNGMLDNCDFSSIGPLKQQQQERFKKMGRPAGPGTDPQQCDKFILQAQVDMSNLNIYDLYADVCTPRTPIFSAAAETHAPRGSKYNEPLQLAHLASSAAAAHTSSNSVLAAALGAKLQPKQLGAAAKNRRIPDTYGGEMPDRDPCVGDHLNQYLNTRDVQTAIHAQHITWNQCSSVVDYSYSDLLTSMIPVYQWLLTNSDIRMLVFSGDIDGIVPITGTRYWIDSMNMTTAEPWRWWQDSAMQTGGWTQVYKWGTNPNGLTFASVRDAGHMVPWTQPMRSWDLYSRFLLNQRL